MPRPYLHFNINEITVLVNDINKDPKIMKEVVAELKYRNTSKSKALLNKLTDRPYVGYKLDEIVRIINDQPGNEIRDAIIIELLFRKTSKAKSLLKDLC